MTAEPVKTVGRYCGAGHWHIACVDEPYGRTENFQAWARLLDIVIECEANTPGAESTIRTDR